MGQVISVHDVPLFDGLKTEGGVHDVMQYATVKLCTMSCYFFVHDVMLLVTYHLSPYCSLSPPHNRSLSPDVRRTRADEAAANTAGAARMSTARRARVTAV